jgi:hypothetical protein
MGHKKSLQCALAMGMVGASLFAGGCASIVHGGDRSISINTQPPGATASVRKSGSNSLNDVVTVQNTPCTVSLDPKKSYFKGQSYTLRLEMPGYRTAEVELTPKMSGWYWGNLVIGGLIGMLAVDPATGSMWNLEPNKIEQTLSGGQSSLIKNKTGFVVVLVSDLTPAEREHMVRLN